MTTDPRIASLEATLRDRGLPAVEVRVGGHEAEVAIVRAPEADWDRVAGTQGDALVAAIREAGFRYVALDLEPAGPPG